MPAELSSSQMAYFYLLLIGLTFLIKQAFVKNKTTTHILFAVFCASLCMMTLQKLSAPSIGIYQYVIGFAACATCNVSWLISRSLFRDKNAVLKRHICVAVLIAILIIANQAWHIVNESALGKMVPEIIMYQFKLGLSETTGLLSSAILLLSFWEALRGFSLKNRTEKIQRIIFASAFFIAVFSSTIVANLFVSPDNQDQNFPWIILFSASLIMLAIELILQLQQSNKRSEPVPLIDAAISTSTNCQLDEHHPSRIEPSISEKALIGRIDALMNVEKIYLQTNIKLFDFAKVLDAPEYKISKLIRTHFDSPNFNHFVNQYRVDHAKNLLRSQDAKDWSILVIAMECGFSSLVSFNRTFKTLAGDKPSVYRSQLL